MTPSRLLLAVTTLAMALLFTFAVPTATAASTAKTVTPPLDTRKLIKSVDAAAGTIEIENMRTQTSRSYKVDSVTSIKVNNAPGKIADIKVGMQVRDTVDRDDQTLDSISVDKADPAPAGSGSSTRPATGEPKSR